MFAPNKAAMDATGDLEDRLNFTQIRTVVSNHVSLTVQRSSALIKSMLMSSRNQLINGSVAYSTLLASTNYTSAAGEPFRFIKNDTGSFIISGNTTARILSADIPIENGVVHVIDRVLVNSESNTEAAEAAVSSYAAQATATTSGVNGASGGASSTVGSATGAATSTKTSSAMLSAPLSSGVAGSFVAIVGSIFAVAALF